MVQRAMFFAAQRPSRRQIHHSSDVHETVNDAVRGLVDGTLNFSEVCVFLDKIQDLAGTTHGVDPEVLDAAKDTVKQMLRARLCTPASDLICAGKTRVHRGNLKRLSEALADAKYCKELSDELDLPEFEQFLHNCEVTANVNSAQYETSAAELMEQLRCHAHGVAGELTDTTAALVCRELLGQMRRSPLVCAEVSRLGLVGLLRRVLTGSEQHETVAASEEHPKLQLCAAHLLAEIAIQRSVSPEDCGPKAAGVRLAWDEASNSMAPARTDLLPYECRKSIDVLYSALHGALQANQHSRVWAVASALLRLVDRLEIRQCLADVGFQSLIKLALRAYQQAPNDLPAPKRMPKPTEKTVSLQPPAFPRPPNTHALARGKRVQERRLRKSASSPRLRGRTCTTSLHDPSGKAPPEISPPLLWLSGQGCPEAGASYKVCDRPMIILQLKRILRVLEQPC